MKTDKKYLAGLILQAIAVAMCGATLVLMFMGKVESSPAITMLTMAVCCLSVKSLIGK